MGDIRRRYTAQYPKLRRQLAVTPALNRDNEILVLVLTPPCEIQ